MRFYGYYNSDGDGTVLACCVLGMCILILLMIVWSCIAENSSRKHGKAPLSDDRPRRRLGRPKRRSIH